MSDDLMNTVWERTRQIALTLLAGGASAGEDRSGWIIDVADHEGVVVLRLTLGEALDFTAKPPPSASG